MSRHQTLLSHPGSLCILRLSAIGDVCHAVAMVQAIQRRHPGLPITWVVGKVEASLLKGLPGVELVVFDKGLGNKAFGDLWRQLKGRRFDVLLHMQVAVRASIASLGIRARVKVGFDRQRAKEGQWLFSNHQIEAQPQSHVLDGFMGFARELGVMDPTPSWDIPVSDEDRAFAREAIKDGQDTLVICPSASKAERNWLPERYAAAADFAINRGLKVLICGGPSDSEKQLAADIQARSNNEIASLVGQTSLKQMLAILARARVVLAPDTGPAHMAVTQGTPVVGLYAHSNPARTGPYTCRDTVVSVYRQHIEAQQQKPLNQIPWGTRAKGKTLMQDIEVAPVLQALTKALNHNQSGGGGQ